MKGMNITPKVHCLLVKKQAERAMETGKKLPLHKILEELLKDYLEE